MPEQVTLFSLFLVLSGLAFASFVNALGYRLAARQTGLRLNLFEEDKRSFCPHCHTMISWHDNIPLASWIVLLGRCRSCGQAIAPIYWIGEFFIFCMSIGLVCAVQTLDAISQRQATIALILTLLLWLLVVFSYWKNDIKKQIAKGNLTIKSKTTGVKMT